MPSELDIDSLRSRREVNMVRKKKLMPMRLRNWPQVAIPCHPKKTAGKS